MGYLTISHLSDEISVPFKRKPNTKDQTTTTEEKKEECLHQLQVTLEMQDFLRI